MKIYLHGLNEASYGAIRVKGRGYSGPLNKLARLLIADGHDESEVVEIYRGSTRCFLPAPLSVWAGRVASESADTCLQFRKYTPMPEELKGERV